jgi:hypothetical protein
MGEASVFQAVKAVAELGPSTCEDARRVREVAGRTGHPSRPFLASAIQSCDATGSPRPGAKAAARPAGRQEKALTRKALTMKCSSTRAERELLVNRWAKLPAEERVERLQELVDRCQAQP